jgi:hypothetical protein
VGETSGAQASITFPAGVLGVTTTVGVNVQATSLTIANPAGVTGAGTLPVNTTINPTPIGPPPAPGVTLVLSLLQAMTPASNLTPLAVDNFRRQKTIVEECGEVLLAREARHPLVGR